MQSISYKLCRSTLAPNRSSGLARLPLYCIRNPSAQQKRWLSTRKPTSEGSREERKRMANLLISIKDFFFRRPDVTADALNHHIRSTLRYHLKNLPSLSNVARSKIITLLIENRRLEEATMVYEGMIKSGVVPSTSTDTQMTAVALSLTPQEELTEDNDLLNSVIHDASYTEERLLQLLETCVTLGLHPDVVVSIVENYLEARRDGFSPSQRLVTKLVEAQARAGQFESAFDTLVQMEGVMDGEESTPLVSKVDPYAALLSGIRDTRADAQDLVERVLVMMKEQGVAPNTLVFNALLVRNLRSKTYEQAFQVFNALLHCSREQNIGPDAETFVTMFSVSGRVYSKSAQSKWSRRSRIPSNAISPRALYRILLSCTQPLSPRLKREMPSQTNPVLINSTLLDTALSAFVASQDYPGAFLMLRAFWLLDIDVTARTYWTVMKHLMKRLTSELMAARLTGDVKWADYFLFGGPMVEAVKVDDDLAKKLLEYATVPRFRVTEPLFDQRKPTIAEDKQDVYGPNKPRTFVTPTLEMMDGEEPVPLGVCFDASPLNRLIRRAILSDIRTTYASAGVLNPGTAIKEAITEAKREMIPMVDTDPPSDPVDSA